MSVSVLGHMGGRPAPRQAIYGTYARIRSRGQIKDARDEPSPVSTGFVTDTLREIERGKERMKDAGWTDDTFTLFASYGITLVSTCLGSFA